MTHNVWSKKPKKPKDFLMEWDQRPMSDTELKQLGKSWVEMMRGSDGESDS